MTEPQIPGAEEALLTCPDGVTIRVQELDMGMREFDCDCGSTHAVVMDVHPLGRWIPESVERILAETIEPTDEYETFGTIHVMGLVLEEFPEKTVVYDASDNPAVGYALVWMTTMDAASLHRIIVELLIELMDHAVSHSDDPEIAASFQDALDTFDIEEFVTEYRRQRDFTDEFDQPA